MPIKSRGFTVPFSQDKWLKICPAVILQREKCTRKDKKN